MSRFLLLSGLTLLLGCGANPGRSPEPVEIEGRVTIGGKPARDVILNLQPTGAGAQAAFPLKEGAFRGSVTPGKYTYYVSETANAAAFKAIPAKFQLGSLDRQIDITAGVKLDLTLD